MGGEDEIDIMVFQSDCYHHKHNVWIGAVNKHLSRYLYDMLACDLLAIDFCYRFSTNFDAILRIIDKEFSLPAIYPKGHNDQFNHCHLSYHPEALLVPVLHTMGSRQDIFTVGDAFVY